MPGSRIANIAVTVAAGVSSLALSFFGALGIGFCGWKLSCLFDIWPILMFPAYILAATIPMAGRVVMWMVAIISLLGQPHWLVSYLMLATALLCHVGSFRKENSITTR